VKIADLLVRDLVARVATIDASGYPHVTPLWFLWSAGAFHLTSDTRRPHLDRLSANPRAGLVIDMEEEKRADGERPSIQVRAVGNASLIQDRGGTWSRRIWDKYNVGTAGQDRAERLRRRPRVLIRIVPSQIIAVASG
jgi:nitroimidazol reductase NimA-like FMN-containing flavoprotein (pyridoxamine 5'-phosphate oxidase superfamily)